MLALTKQLQKDKILFDEETNWTGMYLYAMFHDKEWVQYGNSCFLS